MKWRSAMAESMKCDTCGRFHSHEPGSAWQMVYSGVMKEPDHERTRCLSCVEKHGPFDPQDGIRPEFSCGLVPYNANSSAGNAE